MNFSYSYAFNNDNMEALIATVLFYVAYAVLGGGIGVALYVFRSLGVYSIAKRRGLRKAWFAWVPVVDQYLLGSLSDQYQYVVKARNKAKRKWLLGLNILRFAVSAVMLAMTVSLGIKLAGSAMTGFHSVNPARIAMQAFSRFLAVGVPLAVISVAAAVIRYVALYDVYVSLEPKNATAYTVLSILFHVTEPFFLFFSRNKDEGMPPRRDTQPVEPPVWEASKADAEEPWTNE